MISEDLDTYVGPQIPEADLIIPPVIGPGRAEETGQTGSRPFVRRVTIVADTGGLSRTSGHR